MDQTKLVLYLVVLFFAQSSLAQNQNNQWRFGVGAGINFNTSPPSAVTGSSINTTEGCATISDSATGNLLFYSDSRIIWDANNNPMPNGSGLFGDPSLSSTTAVVIIPMPNSLTRYYVVTINQTTPNQGIHYSIVDMTLNGGLGDVVAGQKNVFLYAVAAEKMTYVPSGDQQGYWLITHIDPGNTFVSIKLDQNGFSATPVLSNAGVIQTFSPNHFKINRQFNKMAITEFYTQKVELIDFNNCTGVFSNAIEWTNNSFPGAAPYGIEFSPDGTKLYLSTTLKITQYTITSNNPVTIANSAFDVVPIGSGISYFSLQLAPDNKIYVASQPLSVINNPNSAGAGCNFQNNFLTIPGANIFAGLQNWVYTIANPVPTNEPNAIVSTGNCAGNPVLFALQNQNNVTGVTWNFGDPSSGASNSGSGLNPSHIFSNSGTYTVTATITYSCGSEIVTSTVTIQSAQSVSVAPISLCQGIAPPILPTTIPATSITGTWSPAVINTSLIGTSTYVFTASTGQCVSPPTTSLIVTILPSSIASFSFPTSICVGSVAPTLPTISDNGIIGTWSPTLVNNTSSGTYTFTPNAGNCAIPVTITININPIIAPTFSLNTIYCTGGAVPNLPLISDNGISGSWFPTTISNSTNGSYVFTPISDSCSTVYELTVTLNSLPIVQVVQGCDDSDFVAQVATVNSGDTYLWFDESNQILGTNSSQIILSSGSYILTVTNNGCTTEFPFVVETIACNLEIPKGLSPNNDGLNDTFDLRSFAVDYLKIFNRYGLEVYGATNYKNEWDGKSQSGNELPDGTYYYNILLNNGDVRTGWVYLNR